MSDINVEKDMYKKDMDYYSWQIYLCKKEIEKIKDLQSKFRVMGQSVEKSIDELNYAKKEFKKGGFMDSGKYYQEPTIEKMIRDLNLIFREIKTKNKECNSEVWNLESKIEDYQERYNIAEENYYNS